jgi:hypothetical protein
MRCSTLTLAALLALPLAPALADEAWMTQFGPLQWEDSRESMAILNLFGPEVTNPAQFRVFLPRLADDVNGGRGAYTGFWTSTAGDAPCVTEILDPMGTKTRHWGQFTLNFVGDDFPSDWAGLMGDCFDAPSYRVTGTVLTDF